VPGREVAALAAALTLTAVGLYLSITDKVTALFDVLFVLGCLAMALAVRPRDFFTVGVLPPLLMLGTFLLVALSSTAAVARADDGVVQAVISGLSHHSLALAIGYIGSLGVLYVRHRVLEQRIIQSAPRHRLPA
ncbi:MAG: DUF6542 domain-containing protein, partial [Nocardioides sp.]